MTFSRNGAKRWHAEVPGARWFRADLHVHTIDDHPGGRAKVPNGLDCPSLQDASFLQRYARKFLQAAVAADVQVIALTPHAVKTGRTPDTCATWAIVDCWNGENDDDGTPFREKVYAVFPGFEPSFNTGSDGLHLLFLFDPEIGREKYLEAFTLVMGGTEPWSSNELQLSSRSAAEAFKELARFRVRQQPSTWDYLVIAPHIDSNKGLFKAQRAQALALFDHGAIAALEISDNKLPAEIVAKKGEWFKDGLRRYRHVLIHGSDAYKVKGSDHPEEFHVGHRVTWLKLAQPRIEALRQAFLAADSRVAIAYERDGDGRLIERTDAPASLPTNRPWLRSVTIEGGASFFGGLDAGAPGRTTVPLNPGLTCVIGASMTGKSTLFDGLRLHLMAEPPSDSELKRTVQNRGDGLLRGGTAISLETPSQNSGSDAERWPAVFYTQNELLALMRAGGETEILRGLTGNNRQELEATVVRVEELDADLAELAGQLRELISNRDQAEQKKAEAVEASNALRAFEDAGLKQLREASRLASLVETRISDVVSIEQGIRDLGPRLEGAVVATETENELNRLLGASPSDVSLGSLQKNAKNALATAVEAVSAWKSGLEKYKDGADDERSRRRASMERKVSAAGHSAEQFANLKALTTTAEQLDHRKEAAARAASELRKAEDSFSTLATQRDRAVARQRQLYDAAINDVSTQFAGGIRVRRIDHALAESLETFLKRFSQKGITQWWNALDADRRPSPQRLAQAVTDGTLPDLGASETVATRIQEAIGQPENFELRALRSEDRYVFEQRLENGQYRSANELSGGRRVSMLLTLLLEMEDPRPLVIDQPEDELDNRVLWDTVLPAVRRLKTRRQLILVTHNANIVVNGDADLVVQFEAEANRGRVALSGAIEQDDIRRAVVETVDGGQDAFELRKEKYGF